MDIPDLGSCQRIKYENELLRRKQKKLSKENEELKTRVEILVSKEKRREAELRIEYEMRRRGLTIYDDVDCNLERDPASRPLKDRKNPPRLGRSTSDGPTSRKDRRDTPERDWRVSIESLAKGDEPKPRPVVSAERERLDNLLTTQNKIIRRYEVQLREASTEASKATELAREVDRLKTEIEALTSASKRMIADAAAATSELAAAKEERDQLRSEVKRLKAELSALDPEFFEEIEDLKFSLVEARKLNREYAKTVRTMSERLGVAPAPAPAPAERRTGLWSSRGGKTRRFSTPE